MKRNKTWFSLGLVALSALALTLILMVLPAGATHSAPIRGVVTVDPEVTSSNDAVDIANRTIKITVTDANMNNVFFVGRGPDGESASFDQVNNSDGDKNMSIPAGNGEQITLTGQGIGISRVVSLKANRIDGFTPIADRNDDGRIDANDIEIVNTDLNDDTVKGDVGVASIFNAERGQVIFDIFIDLDGNAPTFDVRYATSGIELTRAEQTFTQPLLVPSTDAVVGESFTAELTNTLVDDADVMVAAGSVETYGDATTESDDVTTVTFTAMSRLTKDAPFTVKYEGTEVIEIPNAVAAGDTFSVVLSTVLQDGGDTGAIRDHADIEVTDNPAITATGYNNANNTATFMSTVALTTDDTFTVQYTGEDALMVPATGLVENEEFILGLNPAWLPLQDTNGDGAVNSGDVTVSIDGRLPANTPRLYTGDDSIGDIGALSDGKTEARNGHPAASTIKLIHSGTALAMDSVIKVTYSGLEDLVNVRGHRGEEMPLRLLETGANTGIFQATVEVFNGDSDEVDDRNDNLMPYEGSSGRPRLAVINGSSVAVTYRDRSPSRAIIARVQVESELPSFSNTMPADDPDTPDYPTTNDLDTVLTTEVVDSIAGVNPSKNIEDDGTPESVELSIKVNDIPQGVVTGDISVQEIPEGSGVYTVSYNINKIAEIADAKTNETPTDVKITWEIMVKDKAGNQGTTREMTLNVNNHPPALSDAFVGDNWDASVTDDPDTDEDERLRSSIGELPGSDVRTSIRLVFDRAMKGSSLQASDFRVDGVAPAAIEHFSDLANSVFLTVPELSPSATPRIEVVGEVQDAGGNPVNVADPVASVIGAAKDGIAPKLEVTVVDDFTDGDIQLSVKSDEPIIGSLPQRTINMCVNAPTLVCTGDAPSTTASRIVQQQREWSFSVTGFDPGLYVVQVEAQDAAGNKAVAGSADPTSTGAIRFEIDKALPAATSSDPAEDAEKSEAEPFIIEIDWTSEDEYDGDSHKDVTLTKAVLDAGTDNERDVLALSGTRDNQNFSIAISDIGTGKHTLTYNGMDEMGNTLSKDVVLTFTVVSPTPFNLTLTPGMNLISVPREPSNPGIQDVFGDVEEVTLVFTRPFAGESDLPWLIASRDPATDEFVGDLKFIDAKHAYWVKASTTRSVEIQMPPLSAQRVPPTIPVAAGEWSLVPVISLAPIAAAGTPISSTGDIQEGTEFQVNDYFGTDTWSKAFTFDRGQWIAITPSADPPDDNEATLHDAVQVGRGYWILFTKDSNLTPGIKRSPAPAADSGT